MGLLVFPIIGSALVKAVGFQSAFDIFSLVLLINSSIYLVSTMIDWREERMKRGTCLDRNEAEEEQEEKPLLARKEEPLLD